jgi:hypothetical protein
MNKTNAVRVKSDRCEAKQKPLFKGNCSWERKI